METNWRLGAVEFNSLSIKILNWKLRVLFYLDSIDGVQEFLFAEIRHAIEVEMAEGGADGRRQPARVVHVVDEQKFRPAQITRRTVKISFHQSLIISKI